MGIEFKKNFRKFLPQSAGLRLCGLSLGGVEEERIYCYKGLGSNSIYFFQLKGSCKMQEERREVKMELVKRQVDCEK